MDLRNKIKSAGKNISKIRKLTSEHRDLLDNVAGRTSDAIETVPALQGSGFLRNIALNITKGVKVAQVTTEAVKEEVNLKTTDFVVQFPGLTVEHLKQGWIPIHQNVVQRELEKQFAHSEVILNPKFIVPANGNQEHNKFHITAVSSRGRWQAKVHLVFSISDKTEMSKDKKVLALSMERPRVLGLNFLSKVICTLFRKRIATGVVSVVESDTGTGRLFEGEFPNYTVNLNSIDSINSVISKRVFGKGLLDVVSITKIVCAEKHLRVKVQLNNPLFFKY